jgi:hypothetical protein
MTDFWVCANCRSLNRGRAKACYSCRAPYAPYDAAAGGGPAAGPAPAVATAGTALGSTSQPAPAPIPTGPAAPAGDAGLGILGGVIGGATGAVLSTGVWYGVVTATHIQAGIVAIAVGWIVGQAVVLAAGRAAVSLVPVSVAWTLVALVVAQYLIAVQFINELLDANGVAVHLPILAGPADVLDTVWNWLQYDPLTLLFWGIALFEAVVIPWRRTMRRPTTRWPGMPGAAPGGMMNAAPSTATAPASSDLVSPAALAAPPPAATPTAERAPSPDAAS